MRTAIERDANGVPTRLFIMATQITAELVSRSTRNERIRALFLSKPSHWISVKELAKAGGFAAWRSRIAEVRLQFHAEENGTIQWNGNPKDSRYRYLKQIPLGPDAAVPRERKLF